MSSISSTSSGSNFAAQRVLSDVDSSDVTSSGSSGGPPLKRACVRVFDGDDSDDQSESPRLAPIPETSVLSDIDLCSSYDSGGAGSSGMDELFPPTSTLTAERRQFLTRLIESGIAILDTRSTDTVMRTTPYLISNSLAALTKLKVKPKTTHSADRSTLFAYSSKSSTTAERITSDVSENSFRLRRYLHVEASELNRRLYELPTTSEQLIIVLEVKASIACIEEEQVCDADIATGEQPSDWEKVVQLLTSRGWVLLHCVESAHFASMAKAICANSHFGESSHILSTAFVDSSSALLPTHLVKIHAAMSGGKAPYNPLFGPNPILRHWFEPICKRIAIWHHSFLMTQKSSASAIGGSGVVSPSSSSLSAAATCASAACSSSTLSSASSELSEVMPAIAKVHYSSGEGVVVQCKCLDVGSGVGRDSVWLALQRYTDARSGVGVRWQTECIDRNASVLSNLRKLRQTSGCHCLIRAQRVRIRKDYCIVCYKSPDDDDDSSSTVTTGGGALHSHLEKAKPEHKHAHEPEYVGADYFGDSDTSVRAKECQWDITSRHYFFEGEREAVATGGGGVCVRSQPPFETPFHNADGTPKTYDLVLIIRFLDRSLLSTVIPFLLADSGHLIVYTFMVGAERFGKPKNPDYLLKPGELVSLFCGDSVDDCCIGNKVWLCPETGFTFRFQLVFNDEQCSLSDGRPVQGFVVRKIVV